MLNLVNKLSGREITVDIPSDGEISPALTRSELGPPADRPLFPEPDALPQAEHKTSLARLKKYTNAYRHPGLINGIGLDVQSIAKRAQRPLEVALKALEMRAREKGSNVAIPLPKGAHESDEIAALRARHGEIKEGIAATHSILGPQLPMTKVQHVAAKAARLDRALRPDTAYEDLQPSLKKLRDIARFPVAVAEIKAIADQITPSASGSAAPAPAAKRQSGTFAGPQEPTAKTISASDRNLGEAYLDEMASKGHDIRMARTKMQYFLVDSNSRTSHILTSAQAAIAKRATDAGLMLEPPSRESAPDRTKATGLRREYHLNKLALEACGEIGSDTSPSRPTSLRDMARSASVISAALEDAKGADHPYAFMPALIEGYRQIAAVPAVLEGREDREAAYAREHSATELADAHTLARRQPEVHAADWAARLQSLDAQSIAAEAEYAPRTRRIGLIAKRHLLERHADPLSRGAMAIRKSMIAENLILDRNLRKEVLQGIAFGERAAREEARETGIEVSRLQEQARDESGALDQAKLSKMVLQTAHEISAALPVPSRAAARVHGAAAGLREDLASADASTNAPTKVQLAGLTQHLLVMGAHQQAYRPRIKAMEQLVSAMDEPAKSHKIDRQVA